MATYFNSNLIVIIMCTLSIFIQYVASKRYKCKCSCDQCHQPSKCCELVCLNYCVQNPLAVVYVPYPIPILLPKETCEEEEYCDPYSDGTAEINTPEETTVISTPEETTVITQTTVTEIKTETPTKEIDIEQKIKRLLILIQRGKSTTTTPKKETAKITTTTEVTVETTEPTPLTTSELPTTTTKSTTTTPKPTKSRTPRTTKTPKTPKTTPSEDTETTTEKDICEDVPPCIPRDVISDLTKRRTKRFKVRPTRKREKNILHRNPLRRATNGRDAFSRVVLRTLKGQTKSTVGIKAARTIKPESAESSMATHSNPTNKYQTKSTVVIGVARKNIDNLENPAHDYGEIPKLPLRNTFARSIRPTLQIRHKNGMLRATAYRPHNRYTIRRDIYRALDKQTKSTVGKRGAKYNFANIENREDYNDEIVELPLSRRHRIIKQERITARQEIEPSNERQLKTSLELIDMGNKLGEEFDYLLQRRAEEIEHRENAYSDV